MNKKRKKLQYLAICAIVLMVLVAVMYGNRHYKANARMIAVDNLNYVAVFETEDGNQWVVRCDAVDTETEYVLTFDTVGTKEKADDKVVGITERR